MPRVLKDPMNFIISDGRIDKPEFLTEINHWELHKLNDPRWRLSSGLYVFFDKDKNVAYVGKTEPLGDKTYVGGSKRKKQYRQSRIKRHLNGRGGNWSWHFFYKVRLYRFTDNTSRDIYELWWIDQLMPYGNKGNRYYSHRALMPRASIKRTYWSGFQKEAFTEQVPPEDIIMWKYWMRLSKLKVSAKEWVRIHKKSYISSLTKTAKPLGFLRAIRRKARR